MPKKENKKMPKFESLNELVDFFDNNDLGEYIDEMPKVDFEVNLRKRTHIFALDDELVSKLTEIAQTEQTSPEALLSMSQLDVKRGY
jgi:hypothetical protein